MGRQVMAALVLRGPYMHPSVGTLYDASDSDEAEIIEGFDVHPTFNVHPNQSPEDMLVSIAESPSQLDSTKLPSSEDITGRSLAALLQAVPQAVPSELPKFEEYRGGKH